MEGRQLTEENTKQKIIEKKTKKRVLDLRVIMVSEANFKVI